MTAKNAIATSADAEPLASAAPALRAQLAREPARVAAHPHDHERDDPDRGDADDRLQALLLALRQLLVEHLQATPTATQIAIAAATPSHIGRSASRRPPGAGNRRRCRRSAPPRRLRAGR